MKSKNLDLLPTEIIQKILEYLVEYFFRSRDVEYQLICRQWYLASWSVVYRSVILDKYVESYANFNKLESFYNFLQNPTYNMGQYIKEIYLNTNCTMIWDAILKYCATLEKLDLGIDCSNGTFFNYVISARKHSDEKIWEQIESISCIDYGNSYYQVLHLFSDSLKVLDIKDKCDDSRVAYVQDLYDYLGKFKKLEALELGFGVVSHIFGCGLLARYCPATLNSHTVQLAKEDDDDEEGEWHPSAIQLQDSTTNNSYTNLKNLSIKIYNQQHLFTEIMYLKKKFGSLESLTISQGQHKSLEEITTAQEVEEIVSYILSIKSLDIGISCPISLDIV